MILTLGAFDGFHRGHQKLMDRARLLAQGSGDSWAVLTFSPHPQAVLSPSPRSFLFTEQERDLITAYLGIPNLIKINFSRWFAELSPEAFLDYLGTNFPVTGLVVGDDFRYGQARKGDVEQLKESCLRRHWKIAVLPQLIREDQVISSTAIRQRVAGGDVAGAERFLAYPFFVAAVVVPGDRRGRALGFPTANFSIPQGKLLPERGVYRAFARVDGNWRPGALNVGYNPTFEGCRSLRFELHLPGYAGDLYGRCLPVFIVKRLREEMRFERIEELKEQMKSDVSAVCEGWPGDQQSRRDLLLRWEKIIDKQLHC